MSAQQVNPEKVEGISPRNISNPWLGKLGALGTTDFGRRRGSTPDLQGHLSVTQGLRTIGFATLLRSRSCASLKPAPVRSATHRHLQSGPPASETSRTLSRKCPRSRPPRAVPPLPGTELVAGFDARLPFLLLVSCHCRRVPPRPGAPGFLRPVGAAAAASAVALGGSLWPRQV